MPPGVAPAIDATGGTVAFFALVDAETHHDRAGAIVAVTGGAATVVARSAAADPSSPVSPVLPIAPSLRAGAIVLLSVQGTLTDEVGWAWG